MPSLFPSMDPYLEGEMWQEFHATLSNALRAQLLAVLPPKYTALLAKRYALDRHPELTSPRKPRSIYPDVHVARIHESVAAQPGGRPATVISPWLERVPQLRVEVRDVPELVPDDLAWVEATLRAASLRAGAPAP